MASRREKERLSRQTSITLTRTSAGRKLVRLFFHSARTGDIKTMKDLVENKGININMVDEWDNSALYLACLCGHGQIVKYLLEAGCRYDSGSIEANRCFLSSLTENIRQTLKQYSVCEGTVTEETEDIFTFMQRMYELSYGHDTEIVVKRTQYLAHRCILMSRCKFFQDLFMSDSVSKSPDTGIYEISLENSVIKPEGFEAVLKYIYTGKVTVVRDFTKKAMAAAEYFGLSDLKDQLHVELSKKDKDSAVTVQRKQFKQKLLQNLCEIMKIPPTLLSLRQDYACQTDCDYFPDICFSVQETVFECHKIFFVGRSEYFRILLVEREEEQPPAFEDYRPTVRLDDITPDVFCEVVCYIYNDQCQVTQYNFLGLLGISEKFALPGLKQICMKCSSDLITIHNVVSVYRMAQEMGIPKLCTNTTSFMAKNMEQMVCIDDFEQLVEEELARPEPFDQIQFFDNLLYYLRGTCITWDDKNDANGKLTKFNYLLTNKLGRNISLPQFQIGERPVTPPPGYHDHHQRKQKKKEDDCHIL